MSDYTAVSDVSETLRSAIEDALSSLTTPPTVELHDLTSAPSTSPGRVTVFLFDVAEDPSARNAAPTRTINSSGEPAVRRAPASLLLTYIITPWTTDISTAHTVLGRIVQEFHDKAILTGPALRGSLAAGNDALRLRLVPLSIEDRSRVWHAVQRPFRVSLTYEVRVVRLDSQDLRVVAPVETVVNDARRRGGAA